MILPMFFALSGFLVAGSLARCKTLISFLGLRLFRLIPALAVETTLSALILGPLFTIFPMHRYLSDPEFRSYFLNILGDVHFRLPGMFLNLPWSGIVNLQLWTLPYELACYSAIAFLSVLTLVRRRLLFLVGVIGMEVIQFVYDVFIKAHSGGKPISGKALVISFLIGISFYLYRDRIRWSIWIFLISLTATVMLAATDVTSSLMVFPAAYITVYLGLTAPKRVKILLSGDYSYGLFLYGWPVQQAVSSLLPQYRFWWLNLLVSVPVAWAIAAGSWWFVEHPANSRRRLVFKLEARAMSLFTRKNPEVPLPIT